MKNPLASQVDAENSSSSFREELRPRLRYRAIRRCVFHEYRARDIADP
jgi:hypothetical protein